MRRVPMPSRDQVGRVPEMKRTPLDRRRVLKGAGFVGLGLLIPSELLDACTKTASSVSPSSVIQTGKHRETVVLTAHEASVVEEATARLIPGPSDDPSDPDPGARDAQVTRYIDTMLGALSRVPPPIFGGGPFSNRDGSKTDDFADFLPLTPVQYAAWSKRLAGLKQSYSAGVSALDRLAGGDFVTAPPSGQDRALVKNPSGFTTLLFTHAIEGMYSTPEYGGNAGAVGWQSIGFPGDVQPRGYDAVRVSDSDGPDPYTPSAISTKVLKLLQST